MLRESQDGHDPTPWRASVERSRARRRRRASLTRGRRRGTTAALALPAALALYTGVALGSGSGGASVRTAAPSSERAGESSVVALQRALGVTADGVYGPQTKAAVRAFQRRNGLTVDGVAGPQTLGALGVGSRRSSGLLASSRAVRPAAGRVRSRLERIAECESGSDPTSMSSSGRYRGKYQFSRETWRSLGGRGDPAAAPEAEQDRRAANLLRRRGTAPWPSCG